MKVLISFCNNTEGLKRPNLLILDILSGEKRWLDPGGKNFAFTGITCDENFIYALSQSEKTNIFVLDKKTFEVFVSQEITETKDPHSVGVKGENLYIVSTGEDKILKYEFDRVKRKITFSKVFWHPKGSYQKKDTHHLNSIFVHNKEIFVSAFGPKEGERWSSAKNGYVEDIVRKQKLLGGIYHPHSVISKNGNVYCCGSASQSVIKNGKVLIKINFGYTRGLALKNRYLMLGVSSGRKKSKSTGKIVNLDEPGLLIEKCQLLVFKKEKEEKKYKPLKEFNFLPKYKEIYDVISLEDSEKFMSWKYHDPKFEYEAIFQDTGWPWSGHKRFAYDFVRNVKPKVIVELGTHMGTSFWSFCQAVKDGELDSKLFAVDTWKGEEHAGFYGEEVFEEVNKIQKKYYGDLKIKLLRKTFDEAVSEFEDKSIDLLHIDGLHTYEAVKHDFEKWLPKVKKDGVIFFHDTFVSMDDFGVYKLWEELKKKHESLEFYHSFGLGVLFLDSKKYKSLTGGKNKIQRRYAFLSEEKKNSKLNVSISIITQKEQDIQQKDRLIKEKDEKIKAGDEKIKAGDEKIKAGDEKIKAGDEKIKAGDEKIRKLIQDIQRKNQEIKFVKSSKFWKMRKKYLKLKSFTKI